MLGGTRSFHFPIRFLKQGHYQETRVPIPPKFLAFGVTINFLTVSLSSETITKFYINQTIHYWIICVGITLWKEGKARKNIVSPHLLERLSLLGKADLVKAQR